MLVLDLTQKLFIYCIYYCFAAIAVSKQSKNFDKYMREIIQTRRLYICRGVVILDKIDYIFHSVFQNKDFSWMMNSGVPRVLSTEGNLMGGTSG